MSTPPQPPAIPRKTIEESEPLKAYHALMLPFYEQLRDALGEVRFKDNHGAVVTEPTAFTAGASGALTGAFVPCTFQPLAVWFRAEAIDAAKRPTGVFIGGSAYWNTAPRSGEQGFTVTTAPGLTNGTTYLMTFIALPG